MFYSPDFRLRHLDIAKSLMYSQKYFFGCTRDKFLRFRGEIFMNERTDFFTARDFGNGVTRIVGTGVVFCYLVEGKKRALLIDTLTGLGNLRNYVATLTRLPVTVVCTHGHFDHCGGALDFEQAWFPTDDADLLRTQESVDKKFWFERMIVRARKLPMHFTREDFTPERPFPWRALKEGAEFDLGGRTLTAIEIPGHSHGSMGLLDSKTGIFFSGDAGSRSTFVFLNSSTTIEEYLKSLLRLKKNWGPRITSWYNAHNYTESPPSMLDDLIQCCRDALDGKIEGPLHRNEPDYRFVYPVNKKWHRLDGGFGNIIVRLSRLRADENCPQHRWEYP